MKPQKQGQNETPSWTNFLTFVRGKRKGGKRRPLDQKGKGKGQKGKGSGAKKRCQEPLFDSYGLWLVDFGPHGTTQTSRRWWNGVSRSQSSECSGDDL